MYLSYPDTRLFFVYDSFYVGHGIRDRFFCKWTEGRSISTKYFNHQHNILINYIILLLFHRKKFTQSLLLDQKGHIIHKMVIPPAKLVKFNLNFGANIERVWS